MTHPLARCTAALLLTWASQLCSADVILQYFESRWATVERRMPDVFIAGYDAMWLPPASRADSGAGSVGYDVFDRFDLGTASSPTQYGTQNTYRALIREGHRATMSIYADLIVNHNGTRDHRTPQFEEGGGYPGFAVKLSEDKFGDFHDPNNGDRLRQRISGLIDIAQEKNWQYIRHPIEENDDNLPYKKILPQNRMLYPDLDLPANSLGFHPFNVDDPMAGDPVMDNATGVLLRYTQWMLDVNKIDGFRIDAIKHTPEWYFEDFHDATVFERGRPNLDGTPRTPFSFGEVFDGDWNLIGGYVRKDGVGNRDALDFPLFFALRDQLGGSGFGSWKNIADASFDGWDGRQNDGSVGVGFVSSHDEVGPVDENLAYAYLLMRPGYPIVYFNAGQFGSRNFPKPGRNDALGDIDAIVTKLIDIHHEYAREAYFERVLEDDVYVFERKAMCIVGLNDNGDTSQVRYDERTIQTAFAAGTRLHELTGNADDSDLDPDDLIPSVITVDNSRRTKIRVPRNIQRRGYVIYGPINPAGELTLDPVAGEIPPDDVSLPAKLRRHTAVPVITASSFEIRLQTQDADTDDPNEDDNAIFRIDGGGDFNGSGDIDIIDGAFAGYEQFVTENSPLDDGGSGLYRQTVDAGALDDGMHYLRALAFRHRDDGGGAIFQTWSQPFYLDLVPPAAALIAPTHTGDRDVTSRTFTIIARGDRTVNRMHAIIDRSLSEDTLSKVNDTNKMTRDGDEFNFTWKNIVSGRHTIKLVAFEETGNVAVFKYSNIDARTSSGHGPGDCNRDGSVDFNDIDIFVAFLAGEYFDPTGDINGDGELNFDDIDGFVECLINGGC